MNSDTLYVVVPCYNESEVLPLTVGRLVEKIDTLRKTGSIHSDSRVMFVDDGSTDGTWELICRYARDKSEYFCGVKLSRNEGHQCALLAGLMEARKYAGMVISMDADLQDDVDAIDKMVAAYHDGYDVVYGVRDNREADSWFKRNTARSYYRLLEHLGAEVVFDHADFRLMSARALGGLSEFSEVNVYLRGIVPMIGYPSTVVTYKRDARAAGESKYPLTKMVNFALDGITSLSVRPIAWIKNLGAVIFLVSLVVLIYSLVQYIMGNTVSGWTSTVMSIWAIGGLTLLSIGIVGDYVGKVYLESKHRPRYLIEDVVRNTEKERD